MCWRIVTPAGGRAGPSSGGGMKCFIHTLRRMETRKDAGFESRFARFAPFVLGVAMVFAAAVALIEGRGMSFTPDEWLWVIASPGMDVKTAFLTSTGHLQLVPRVLYKSILEIDGTNYIWFRLLTVLALLLLVAVFYRYLSKRVGPMVALVPSLLMLFFGSDALHIIRGNGFTILFSLACGIAALLALERADRKGDAVACLLLVLGLSTYTDALPFVAAAAVFVVLKRQRSRLWVPAIPVILYAVWKYWLSTAGPQSWGGSLHTENIVKIPAWIFDSLAAVLSAITGFGYGLTATTVSGPDDVIGPALAILAIAAMIWRLSRGSIGNGVWVAISAGVTLWAIQCLASDPAFPGFRTAESTRYLFPGAIVTFMIAAELLAGKTWSKPAYAIFVAFALFGLASNFHQILEYSDQYQSESTEQRRAVTAESIYLDESNGARVPQPTEPVIGPDIEGLNEAMARRPYGGIGLTTELMLEIPDADRVKTDQQLASSFGFALAPPATPGRRCTIVEKSQDGRYESELPPGAVVVEAKRRSGEVSLGRFSDEDPVKLGTLRTGEPRGLITASTQVDVPWRIYFTGPGLRICRAVQ